MELFDRVYSEWIEHQLNTEKNGRRLELLRKGLGHGTVEFLRTIWYPTIGNLDHLYAEYEVRDFHNGYRYLDLAYLPANAKGCIEIHGYRSHARDVEVSRFKDLCMKQALLVLDDWCFLPIAYPSIREDPALCKQLVLSFVGKFLAIGASVEWSWEEAEAVRYARRLVKPFTPLELGAHLRLSDSKTRSILRGLVDRHVLEVASGKLRYRTYRLKHAGAHWLTIPTHAILTR